MKTFEIRKLGDKFWDYIPAESMYEAAEVLCERQDDEGNAQGIVYEIADGGRVHKVKVFIEATYNAYDVED